MIFTLHAYRGCLKNSIRDMVYVSHLEAEASTEPRVVADKKRVAQTNLEVHRAFENFISLDRVWSLARQQLAWLWLDFWLK
jgi:hypothetical protein